MNDDLLIPLSVLALDLHTTATELADQLADQVLADDLGRPAIDRPIARQLIAEHQDKLAKAAAAQRERAEAHRQRMAAIPDPAARVKALQRQAAARRAAGLWDDNLSAFEQMIADDDAARREASTKMDDYLNATGTGYRIPHGQP